jgi:hypothetical protein
MDCFRRRQDLKDLMRRSGEVTFANAHNDRRNEGSVQILFYLPEVLA